MNIKEIAKEANMSIATVSRVINHPDRVSLATLSFHLYFSGGSLRCKAAISFFSDHNAA